MLPSSSNQHDTHLIKYEFEKETIITLPHSGNIYQTGEFSIPDKSENISCGIFQWARCINVRVANAPGMPGTFSQPPRVSDPDMHLGTYVTHVPLCMPGSLTSGFLWSRCQGKHSWHSRRLGNPYFMYLVRGPLTTLGWCYIQLCPCCISLTSCHNAIYSCLISFTPPKSLKYVVRVCHNMHEWGQIEIFYGAKCSIVLYFVILWSYYHFIAE